MISDLVTGLVSDLATGLVRADGGSISATDWENYTGVDNGSEVTFNTALESARIAGIACFDSQRAGFIYLEEEDATDFVNFKLAVRTSDAYAEADALRLDHLGNSGSLILTRLSDTRMIATGADSPDALISLIGLSSTYDEITGELDTETIASYLINRAARASDTVAFCGGQGSASTVGYVSVIDAASDTLTAGTPVDFTTSISDATSGSAICALTSSSGLVCFDQKVVYFTVSGTVPTAVASADYASAATHEREIVNISETEAVIFYTEDDINGPIKAVYIKYDAGFTVGTPITVDANNAYNNKQRRYGASLGGRKVAFAYDNTTDSAIYFVVLSADTDGTLSIVVQRAENSGRALPTIDAIPNEETAGVTKALMIVSSDNSGGREDSYTKIIIDDGYAISAGGGLGTNPAGTPITDITGVSSDAFDLRAGVASSYPGSGTDWFDLAGNNDFVLSGVANTGDSFQYTAGDLITNASPSASLLNIGKVTNDTEQWVGIRFKMVHSVQVQQFYFDSRRTSAASGSVNRGAYIVITNEGYISFGNRQASGGAANWTLGYTLTDGAVYDLFLCMSIASDGTQTLKRSLTLASLDTGTVTAASDTPPTWVSGTDSSTFCTLGNAFNHLLTQDVEAGTEIMNVCGDYRTGTGYFTTELVTAIKAKWGITI